MRLLLSENPRVILKTDKASYSAAIREVGTTPTERVFALAFSGQTPTGDAFQFADGQLILQLKQAVSGIPNAADVKSVRLMGVLSTSGRSSNNISRVFLLP